ncbi:PD40 domain-containing protein [Lacimicrobium sp. SS2-24]|uniref:PD40 domain-containing protein n=1 Tax=Lacimicrobium sp. SS2-24 TaxID=2005569 RepID=UPI000B4BDF5C|nr:PD40 domain-containing protein [Lacimicrobium sp. SS2-24]
MPKKVWSALSLILISFCLGAKDQHANVALSGIYLGEKLPGETPTLFAPGIISLDGRYEFGISFSPDLKEIYFSGNKKGELSKIFMTQQVNGKWTPVTPISFTKQSELGELHPFVSHDGNKLYFSSHDSEYKENQNWYVQRKNHSWSTAINLGEVINQDEVFDVSESANGDLYYTNISKMKMYYAPFKSGRYPEQMEVGIDSGIHGVISKSQDFLIVDARHKERKDKDLYVYFKLEDGGWSDAINLGDKVNTTFNETVPNLTPDGKFLFFSRYDEKNGLSNFYWVSSKIIEDLRPY